MNFQWQQQQEQQHRVNKERTGLILQDACTSFIQNFQMQSINSFQHLSSQYIDQVVEIEMKRFKANCHQEEANYVEQMLLENPIIVERRTATSFTPLTKTKAAALPLSTKANHHAVASEYLYRNGRDVGGISYYRESFFQELQKQTQQISDSCRRSRINNKVKKAKTKYQHKFISQKLLQSVNVLECLQKLIKRTENQLINQGFNALQLLKLKNNFYEDSMIKE